jgi:hypothetical protein
MEFVDTFWATMWGALAGAFAAWLFSLDLRRREAKDGDRTRLDAAVADVVRLLGEVGGSGEAFMFAVQLGNPAVPAPPPHLSRQQLLSATLAARMAAGEDEGPLLAVYELVTRKDEKTANRAAIDYEHAAHLLVRWRRGKVSTTDAKEQIAIGSPPPARPEH